MRILLVFSLAVCFLITGCKNEEKTITTSQIKDMFSKYGIQLLDPVELNPTSVFSKAYSNVMPERFDIDENQSISIYMYSSSKEAKEGIKDFEKMTAAADVTQHTIYQIANVFIFYVADESFKDQRVEFITEDLRTLAKTQVGTEQADIEEPFVALDMIENELSAQGLELKPVEVRNEWVLNGVKPSRYTVGSPKENKDPSDLEHVSIYIFKSEQRLEIGLNDFHKQTELYDMIYPRIYKINNAMIFYWARGNMDESAKFGTLFEKVVEKLLGAVPKDH